MMLKIRSFIVVGGEGGGGVGWGSERFWGCRIGVWELRDLNFF